MIIRILLMVMFCGVLCFGTNVSGSPYGINVHTQSNAVLQKVIDAGIKWIRVDAVWKHIEKNPGLFDWSNMDRVINYSHDRGLSILVGFGDTPGWANNGKGGNYSADNVAYWERFVKAAVLRYKGKVKCWSIWNEPNLQQFNAENKENFLNRIFIPGADAVKTADPTAFVVGPDLSHLTSTGVEWYFWLKYMLVNAKDKIDVISHHIYDKRGASYIYRSLEDGDILIPSVKKIIEDEGCSQKPFWVTEVGWNTFDYSEKSQGDRYLEMLKSFKKKMYPDKVFFYEIADDLSNNNPPWGIIKSDLTEKPAYIIYKDFIAGRYDDDLDNDDDDGDKKCPAKKSASKMSEQKSSSFLGGLYSFRDQLISFSPSTRVLTHLYYSHSEEFENLRNQDSRIRRVSDRIFATVSDHRLQILLSGGKEDTEATEATIKDADFLVKCMKENKLSPELKKVINWSEKELEILKKIETDEYITNHLPQSLKRLDPKLIKSDN